MANLHDIRKSKRLIEFDGEDGPVKVEVRALSIGKILDLVSTHGEIASAFFEGQDRGISIAASVCRAGSDALNSLIDAGTGYEPGTAADADLATGDALRLASAILDVTLDEKTLGKLRTEAAPMIQRLGLEGVVKQALATRS